MRTDFKGCSTCQPGQEQFEGFKRNTHDIHCMIQYDYRSFETHELFTGIFKNIVEARKKRDAWLKKIGAQH